MNCKPKFNDEQEITFHTKFEEDDFSFTSKFEEFVEGKAEAFEGPYEVTPKLEEQTIPTASKVMRNDMKIKEIPIATVSNSSGGNTVIIG